MNIENLSLDIFHIDSIYYLDVLLNSIEKEKYFLLKGSFIYKLILAKFLLKMTNYM